MIITRLFIENLYGFKSTELDLSFTRLPVDSAIQGEFLEKRPKFYFKKVCVLSGANASGKTSLGKILVGIQNYITKRILYNHYIAIGDKTIPARFSVDFTLPQATKLYRLEVTLESLNDALIVKHLRFGYVSIRLNDSCRVATKRLASMFESPNFICSRYDDKAAQYFIDSDVIGMATTFELLDNFTSINSGWFYIFSENNESSAESDIRLDILKRILMTFDTSILDVVPLIGKGEKNKKIIEGFSVRFNNKQHIVIGSTGLPDQPNRLSRGTYEAIKVALLLSRIIDDKTLDEKISNDHKFGATFFLDEKMAFAHTELEQLVLTLLIDKLPRYGQLFYTTHNVDVLDMNLPAHSYTFIKKEGDNSEFIDAISLAKKNDRSLKTLVLNDCFGTKPNDELLFELLASNDYE
ncbi:AAA family ATPase [Proteus mirabilis]|uniref:AAA family ATPase n=1 Tax=Proteus mirabilis TaxID=584 RepID=UPI0023F89593|nr:AAA family ATPase [Proteus mirabilis]MDF7328297.1 ATP-binding protein [Proteus mirabilis]